jgi:WD40 repeat protein
MQNVGAGHDRELIGWLASTAFDGPDHGDGAVLVVGDRSEVVVVVPDPTCGVDWPQAAVTSSREATAAAYDDGRRQKVVVICTPGHSSMITLLRWISPNTGFHHPIHHFHHFCDNTVSGVDATAIASHGEGRLCCPRVG